MTGNLTRELVREYFDLDENSGILYHRKKRRGPGKVGDIAGRIRNRGKWEVTINGKRYRRHRIVFLYVHGFLPPQLDHRDRNMLNDRPANLRPATPPQNAQNKEHKRGKHLLGAQRGSTNTFQVQMRANGKRIYLGSFPTEEAAHEAYKEASLKYHGEFSLFANKGA
jgi:hypothetical protein